MALGGGFSMGWSVDYASSDPRFVVGISDYWGTESSGYSVDGGKTWAQHDLKEFGKRSPTRLHEKNSDGWFRMDLRSGWIAYAEVLFLKPKDA